MRIARHILFNVAIAVGSSIGLGMPGAAASPPMRAEVDLLELRPGPGSAHFALESTFTVGAGLRQFALKADAGSDSRVAFDWLQFQALWMPQMTQGVTLAFGIRRDQSQGSSLTYAVAGAEFDIASWLGGEHYFYLSRRGDLTGGAKLVARWPLSTRLTLEPRMQLGWSAQEIRSQKLGAGLTDLQISVRFRRTIGRNADIYLGAIHKQLIGNTYSAARAAGDAVASRRAVVGFGLSY